MAFPTNHLLVTAQWSTVGGEIGQTSIRVNRSQAATQTEANACATAFGIMWSAVNSHIDSGFAFNVLKIAQVQPDGKYPTDSEPTYASFSPVYGGQGSPVLYPLQVACVASLVTSQARGLASKGRLFLPAIATVLQAGTYRWPTQYLNERAATVAAMLGGINNALSAAPVVMSRVGSGEVNVITGVRVGNRPDIHRSRDQQVPESYGATQSV